MGAENETLLIPQYRPQIAQFVKHFFLDRSIFPLYSR
jgi:hypothetical protein